MEGINIDNTLVYFQKITGPNTVSSIQLKNISFGCGWMKRTHWFEFNFTSDKYYFSFKFGIDNAKDLVKILQRYIKDKENEH